MGTSESCCKKDVAPVASREFKEIIHAARVMEAEDMDKISDDLQDLRVEDIDAVDASPQEFEEEHAMEPDVRLDPSLLRGISLHRSLRGWVVNSPVFNMGMLNGEEKPRESRG
eukprot:s3042_g1.t1